RARAVADIRGVRFAGFLAWALWLGVHIFFLIGFRNRVMVMMQWAYAYFAFKRGNRLIIESTERLRRREEQAAAAEPVA
ncbi:MAG: hypothetical protein VYC34_11955, partial [Planctomycetota bacterium]|nr:hypothetical protein [Planctomycetota bacterium]